MNICRNIRIASSDHGGRMRFFLHCFLFCLAVASCLLSTTGRHASAGTYLAAGEADYKIKFPAEIRYIPVQYEKTNKQLVVSFWKLFSSLNVHIITLQDMNTFGSAIGFSYAGHALDYNGLQFVTNEIIQYNANYADVRKEIYASLHNKFVGEKDYLNAAWLDFIYSANTTVNHSSYSLVGEAEPTVRSAGPAYVLNNQQSLLVALVVEKTKMIVASLPTSAWEPAVAKVMAMLRGAGTPDHLKHLEMYAIVPAGNKTLATRQIAALAKEIAGLTPAAAYYQYAQKYDGSHHYTMQLERDAFTVRNANVNIKSIDKICPQATLDLGNKISTLFIQAWCDGSDVYSNATGFAPLRFAPLHPGQ